MVPVLMKWTSFVVMLAVSITLTACNENKKGENFMPVTERLSVAEWHAVAKKRVVFGHQSVGANILAGVQSLAKEAGVAYELTESRSAPSAPGITHFKVGKNEDPMSKIKDFEDTLRGGAVQGVDIALVKLCYVDINSSTDVQALAEAYSSSLDRLSREFPDTVFIAVTVALRTVQSGPKAWLKRLLGREPGGYADNFRRQELNTILRSRYGGKGRLFDLAKYEAEVSGNHQYQGQPLEVLNPALSDDGGHLNAIGEQYVAAKLLKVIATSSNTP